MQSQDELSVFRNKINFFVKVIVRNFDTETHTNTHLRANSYPHDLLKCTEYESYICNEWFFPEETLLVHLKYDLLSAMCNNYVEALSPIERKFTPN